MATPSYVSYIFIDGMLLLFLIVIALLTHATTRHVVGALAVGTFGAFLHAGHIVLGQALGWWSASSSTLPHGHWLMSIGLAFWLGAGVGLICWQVVTMLVGSVVVCVGLGGGGVVERYH